MKWHQRVASWLLWGLLLCGCRLSCLLNMDFGSNFAAEFSGGGAAAALPPCGGDAAPAREVPMSNRTAVYAVLALTPDHYKDKDDLILRALYLRCSAICHGSSMPFHLIFGGIGKERSESRKAQSLLKSFGWVIEDRRADHSFVKEIYKPVYTEEDARKEGRWWYLGAQPVQERRDGWATYFKFFAWAVKDFDRVLMVDLDIFFSENPDPYVDRISRNVTFQASPEGKRFHLGLNSHMMVIAPSKRTFHELVKKARKGEYIPWTNTEQDVLEMHFTPRFFAPKPMKSVIPHAHTVLAPARACRRPPDGPTWPPSTCSQVLRMCNFSDTGYKDDWLTLSKCW